MVGLDGLAGNPMVSGGRRNPEVDAIMAKMAPGPRAIAQALRDFILEAGPELQETVKWSMPCYVGKSNVCSIGTYQEHTNLEFYRGAHLHDPKKLLEGTGKGLRHVKVYAPADVKPALLRPLLRHAIALDKA